MTAKSVSLNAQTHFLYILRGVKSEWRDEWRKLAATQRETLVRSAVLTAISRFEEGSLTPEQYHALASEMILLAVRWEG